MLSRCSKYFKEFKLKNPINITDDSVLIFMNENQLAVRIAGKDNLRLLHEDHEKICSIFTVR